MELPPVVHAAADLLVGASCPGCGVPGLGVCAACRRQLLDRRAGPVQPRPCPAGFPATVAAGPYDTVTRALLLAYKERGAGWLCGLLARCLDVAVSLACAADARTPVWLVPMPSDPRAVRARGLDVTAALAGRVARRGRAAGPPCEVHRLLRQRRRPQDQAGLGIADRWANLHGALEARAVVPPGVRLVVVDDVVTTGASLTDAARALRAAGGRDIRAAVVAATLRRSPAPTEPALGRPPPVAPTG